MDLRSAEKGELPYTAGFLFSKFGLNQPLNSQLSHGKGAGG